MTDDTHQWTWTPQPPEPPRLELLEPCWRLMSKTSSRKLECGIYKTVLGPEVRVGYGDLDLVQSQLAGSMEQARELAQGFREAILDTQGFVDVTLRGLDSV